MDTKLIFVTGGVVSSLGKGITAAALGRLLKARGYSVSIMKLDPYLNVDPGTMNPYQHGEVFVTDDGAETDLDIGHYERFINEELTKLNNTTTGQIYSAVLDRERRGGYQGGTVQVIPHITDEIKLRIKKAINAIKPEIMLVEIGGTVGDIESQPFLEAIRQLKTQLAQNQCCFIHVTLIPYLSASGELKTKPTQHSVKELQSIGIQPDVLVCRSDYPLDRSIRAKIGLFCNVAEECVIENLNARSLYDVPLMLEERGLCSVVLKKLALEQRDPDLAHWRAMVESALKPTKECTIALVGKYVELHDAYLSVAEALEHSGIANDARVNIKWIAAEELEHNDPNTILADVDGILVPGGFGERGVEGMMIASRYAREHNIPYFGICLGMQIAVIEYARHILGWKDANSTEFDFNAKHPVIALMEDQVNNLDSSLQDFGSRHLLFIGRCRAVDSPTLFFTDIAFHVDRVTQDVHDTTQSCFTYRDFDRVLEIFDFQTTTQTVGRTHGDGTYDTAAELLLNFQHQALFTIHNLKSIVHARYGILREFDVNHGADYLDNFSSSHLESSTN